MVGKDILRKIAHIVFRVDKLKKSNIKEFAKNLRGKKILELGSGKKEKGHYRYSVKKFFDSSNLFLQSDINPNFGHKVIDAEKMNYKNEFDVILCLNVLEHTLNYEKVINNIYMALKPKGAAVFIVPVFYPLHDEPADYWRFTEHSLRKLLSNFKKISLNYSGLRQYPFAYFIKAIK